MRCMTHQEHSLQLTIVDQSFSFPLTTLLALSLAETKRQGTSFTSALMEAGVVIVCFLKLQVVPDLVNGSFHSLMNSTPMVQEDGSLTLGALSFQQFEPKDLKVLASGIARTV